MTNFERTNKIVESIKAQLPEGTHFIIYIKYIDGYATMDNNGTDEKSVKKILIEQTKYIEQRQKQ